MRIGIGPNSRGVTAKWCRCWAINGMFLIGTDLHIHGSIRLKDGAWYASVKFTKAGPFEHRWQAKRIAEKMAGDRIHSKFTLKAGATHVVDT